MREEDLQIIDQIKQLDDYFAKAKLLHVLIYQHHNALKDVASWLTMKPSYLCHVLRLNRLSEIIMDGYYAGLISISHLFVISLVSSQEDQNVVYEKVLRENWTVKQTEDHIRTIRHGVSSEGEYIPQKTIEEYSAKINKLYKAKIRCVQTRIRAKVIIEWKGSRSERKEKIIALLKAISHSL